MAESGNRAVETATVPERKLDVRNTYSEASLREKRRAARCWAAFLRS
jgi:hypothetical protein